MATVVVDLHMLDTVEAALLQHDETIGSMLETGKPKLDPDAAALRVANILDRHAAWIKSEKQVEKGLASGEGEGRCYAGSTEVMKFVGSADFAEVTRIISAHMKGIKGRAPASPAQVLLMIVSARMLLLYKFMLGIMEVSRTLIDRSFTSVG